MTVSPLAGKQVPVGLLVDVPRLIAAYYNQKPDPSILSQRVVFGTSGHRGSSFTASFNEDHVLAITEAICLYRSRKGINGPLFLGIDTHALSVPASQTALEVLAAHGIQVRIAPGDEPTPTPVVSHAILAWNKGRTRALADGIVVTPSHNPPQQGGFKYNPPSGGPAEGGVTDWIEAKANALLETHLAGVRRIAYRLALARPSTQRHDYMTSYVDDLVHVVDLERVRQATLHLGVDPMGGAGVHYWSRIAERYGLDLTVVNTAVDPTFRFMSVDWDGQVRMDPSSPYAMSALIAMKGRFDLAFACDTDHDRHGIVTRGAGLLAPNHALCSFIDYLFRHRPNWPQTMEVGKTMVSSALIDRLASQLNRRVYEVPVGFKWFVEGLLDGSLGFAGEESAGATFARRDGSVWTTDKDGFVPCLLAAEMLAKTGRDPCAAYATLSSELGASWYERVDSPAAVDEKAILAQLTPGQVTITELAGEPIRTVLAVAPGNSAPLGGIKVETATGWFAARPSGTEALFKIYAESFCGEAHLSKLLTDAQAFVSSACTAPPVDAALREPTVASAIEAWENEGDPN